MRITKTILNTANIFKQHKNMERMRLLNRIIVTSIFSISYPLRGSEIGKIQND